MRSFVALKSERGMLLFALFMLLVLTLVSIVARPMTPIDETRYIGVAWVLSRVAMWLNSVWRVT